MAYTAWSVVFGEQPTAAKWNQLGENDAGFKDGSNIDNDAILSRMIPSAEIIAEKLGQPLAFLAYQSSNQSVTAGAFTKVSLQSESYDYGSDFDSSTNYRYTAPHDGIYHFHARTQSSSGSASQILTLLYVNGSAVRRGNQITGVAGFHGSQVVSDIKLNATDYVEFYVYITGATANLANGITETFMGGHLIGRLD